MLHNETRNLLIQAYNKTHNAKEVAECSKFPKYIDGYTFLNKDIFVPLNNLIFFKEHYKFYQMFSFQQS